MNPRKLSLGLSKLGYPLTAFEFSPQSPPTHWILILGSVHGDEKEGLWLCNWAVTEWSGIFPSDRLGAIVWPEVNPEGVYLKQRWNSQGIDLNRNLPSKDWTAEILNPRYPPGKSAGSEPENQALIKLIQDRSPVAIISMHSYDKYQVNVNGPAHEWGERLSKLCSYPMTENIGYPTPGSLGTYAGLEKQIPTITLEIEWGLAQEKVIQLHSPLLQDTLNYWNAKL